MKVYLEHDIQSGNSIEKINISGSKSESNRLLILQAQFPQIAIENISSSDDTKVLQKALQTKNGTVDIHHAGTAMRFLTAYYASLKDANVTLTGSQRMKERPVGILVEALRSLGGNIQYLEKEGYPPLKIIGQQLEVGEVNIQSNVSSQYISALMLIGPMLKNGIKINLIGKPTSVPYIEMTLSLLKKIGLNGQFSGNAIEISSEKNITKTTVVVESDWSSASYFYSLVSLSKTFEITLSSFFKKSFQGDSNLVSIYEQLGVSTTFNSEENSITLKKSSAEIPKTISLDLADTPDLAQTIAVTCFGLKMGCRLKGLHTLKIKETDRLIALQHELQKFGAVVIVDKDSFKMEPAKTIKSDVLVETYQDHRMAMAFAPLALKTNLYINDPLVVTKSYPDFWKDLDKVGVSTTLKE